METVIRNLATKDDLKAGLDELKDLVRETRDIIVGKANPDPIPGAAGRAARKGGFVASIRNRLAYGGAGTSPGLNPAA